MPDQPPSKPHDLCEAIIAEITKQRDNQKGLGADQEAGAYYDGKEIARNEDIEIVRRHFAGQQALVEELEELCEKRSWPESVYAFDLAQKILAIIAKHKPTKPEGS